MLCPFEGSVTGVFTATMYYEFAAFGVGKSLRYVISKEGIEPRDIIAFGDGQNDRSIIEYAGVGVSMGNAVEEIKRIADEITLSNNEDGIEVFLDRYLSPSTTP